MSTRPDLTLVLPDGREAVLPTAAGETILESAEAAGFSLPFGCRTGACASCVGRLRTGRVAYVRPPRALKASHVEAGYVLCCVARLCADSKIEVGATVRAALVSNPWR